jgi:hypothetical protein
VAFIKQALANGPLTSFIGSASPLYLPGLSRSRAVLWHAPCAPSHRPDFLRREELSTYSRSSSSPLRTLFRVANTRSVVFHIFFFGAVSWRMFSYLHEFHFSTFNPDGSSLLQTRFGSLPTGTRIGPA